MIHTLETNQEELQQLNESLDEDYLTRARAAAYVLDREGGSSMDVWQMQYLARLLNVDELHVIDENGIITESTIDAYVGFDMKSGEQSNAFMVIVDDPSIEIAQEPQVNVAEGVVMQYIGVARQDAPRSCAGRRASGSVGEYVGWYGYNVVLKGIDFGENGYVYAIDAGKRADTGAPECILNRDISCGCRISCRICGEGEGGH